MGLRDRVRDSKPTTQTSSVNTTLGQRVRAKVSETEKLRFVFSGIEKTETGRIQDEISYFVNPVPLSMVFEWLYIQSKNHPAIQKKIATDLKADQTLSEPIAITVSQSSILIPREVSSWITRTVPERSKAATILMRWMVRNWNWIKKETGWKPA